jgi:hypothetical protein
MIRRMEARISSIDGSCTLAGWFIAESPLASCFGSRAFDHPRESAPKQAS